MSDRLALANAIIPREGKWIAEQQAAAADVSDPA